MVDDELKVRRLVRSYLEHAGHSVLEADTGQRALETASIVPLDLVILELILPDICGEEVTQSLRSTSDLPIIILTAKAGEDDRVCGLQLGADDYIVKPFSPRELVARTERILVRVNQVRIETGLSFGGGALTVDRESREVTTLGRPVSLTRSEFDLLLTLVSRPGHVYTRSELAPRVQGHCQEEHNRTIDVHVKNLRRKLGDDPHDPRFVRTVVGVGYRFGLKADA